MNTKVSKNWEIIFDILFLNHSFLLHNFSLILEKIYMSKKFAITKANILAKDILTDIENIVSYAISVHEKRIDGGNQVKNIEVKIIRIITINETFTICFILSLPKTSTIMSLIEYITGNKKIATLALNWCQDIFISGNVFAHITSEAKIQKMYIPISKSSLFIFIVLVFSTNKKLSQ